MAQEHKIPTVQLGLDEALLQVNTKDFQSSPDLAGSSDTKLQMLYQIEPCFGCPLKKLEPFKVQENVEGEFKLSFFKLSTKHAFSHLELRKTSPYPIRNICKLSGPFNAQNNAEFSLLLDENNNSSTSDYVSCSISKLKNGPCDLCWLLTALGIVFAISMTELLWDRFVSRRRQRSRRLVYDSSVQTTADSTLEAAKTTSEQTELKLVGAADDQHQRIGSTLDINREQQKASKRLDCLDAFRGMTITGMIMVNYGGAGYSSILDHAPWDGLTPADLVFPFFIFSMGASIGLSIRSLLRNHDAKLKLVLFKVFRRSTSLMFIGLCLNSQVLSQPSGWFGLRLPGVLQRFAISYRIVALCYALELYTGTWIRDKSHFWCQRALQLTAGRLLELILATLCASAYIFFTLFFVYDSSCPVGYTGPGGQTQSGLYANCTGGAAGWIDRRLLGESHLWRNHDLEEIYGTTLRHDPEGILGYTTSVLLTLVGLSTGLILIDKKLDAKRKLLSLFKWFILMLAICYGLIIWIPINKSLWSLSFVGATGASSILTLSILYVIVDVCQCHRFFLLKLWLAAGKNSLFLYIGHSLIHKMLPWWFPVNETSHAALLLQLLWSTFVWLLFARWLDIKRLYLKL